MEPPPPTFDPYTGDLASQAANPGFDYRQFMFYVLERLWLVALCLLAGTFLGIGYLYRTPKLYGSRMVLEVDAEEQHIAPVEEVQVENMQSLDELHTIEQNLRSRSLMLRVAQSEHLTKNRDFLPPSADGKPHSDDEVASALLNMVNPVIRRGTRLIDVSVLHTDPKIAQEVADAVGREYIRQSIDKRTATARLAYDFLREEAEKEKSGLQDAENKLQAYREANGAVSPEDRANLVESKLRDMSSRVTQLKAERLRLQTDSEQMEKFGNDPDKLLTVPSIANHPTVVDIKNQIATLNASIANLAQRYKDEHPKMIQARSQLTELQKNLKEAVLRLPPQLKSQYDNSAVAERNLQDALAEQEKISLELNKQTIPFMELQREVDANKALYESVLKRVNETDLTKGIQADPVQIQETATFSPTPVSPLPLNVMTIGVLGGLVVGFGIVFVMNQLDRTIKTVDQAEYILGLPAMAAIPDMKFGPDKSYMLMQQEKNSSAAEAFRTLRASLALLGPEAERKVLIFTSAVPSEGKSFSCTNYSVSLAQQDHRTLLIDGDLRRPSLHRIFGVDKSLPGVTDYLVGNTDLQKAVIKTEVDNLYLLPGGQKAPNPAELLSGHRFADLVAEASKLFDRVVFDSAPVIAVSDTLVMTPLIQSVCLVVRAKKTTRNVVKRAIGLLDQTGHRPVGFVLNRLPRRTGMGYYYYYSEHGYGGNVYGSVSAKAGASDT